MKRGEEIQVTIEKGKTLIIKMNGFSEPDEDGNRIVLFEFNGQPRSIKVHDKHAKTTGVVRRKADESNLVKSVLHCLALLLRFSLRMVNP